MAGHAGRPRSAWAGAGVPDRAEPGNSARAGDQRRAEMQITNMIAMQPAPQAR